VRRKSDQPGESLLAGKAGDCQRRVTPTETVKRQPLKSVLWKVEPDGRKKQGGYGFPDLSENGKV